MHDTIVHVSYCMYCTVPCPQVMENNTWYSSTMYDGLETLHIAEYNCTGPEALCRLQYT
jgi:hypothetical protein